MALKIAVSTVQQQGGTSLNVALEGSLDTSTAPELKAKLDSALNDPLRLVVFDLKGLEFLSSAGLQVFVGVQKRMKERDGKVAMLNMQPQIQKVFDIVKAMASFSIFASQREMDEYLTKIQADHRNK